MIIFIVVILFIGIGFYVLLQQPQFGKAPSDKRLERIKLSPNYKDKHFKNIHYTPQLTEGTNMISVLVKFFFKKSKRGKPAKPLPSVKTNLQQLDVNDDVLVWFGHSSYYMQLDGKKLLVDPVFSGHASPFTFMTKSFAGADIYTADDFPEIDYLVITHDHYDHLDYETISKLKPKVKKVITSLGIGAHLEHWGYDSSIISEADWNDEITDKEFKLLAVTARHFSGRTYKRDNTIWSSFILTTPSYKIFIGGDSGYDDHFKNIGDAFGPFDLVLLENGQYNESWKYIHMMPEEAVQAAIDLKAKKLMPVHWGKFALSIHAWDEPIIRLTTEAKNKNVSIIHPMIGEMYNLNQPAPQIEWWKELQ